MVVAARRCRRGRVPLGARGVFDCMAVAMVFPWILDRAGADPALGSGPLATVTQDLLSIATYLAIATRVIA